MPTLQSDRLRVFVTDDGLLSIAVDGWRGFQLANGHATVRHSAGSAKLSARALRRKAEGVAEIVDEFEPGLVVCRRILQPEKGGAVTLEAELSNAAGHAVELEDVRLLDFDRGVSLGEDARHICIYEQGGYWARVRSLRPPTPSAAPTDERDASQAPHTSSSDYVWLAYDRSAGLAILLGFETGDRWTGRMDVSGRAGQMPSTLSAGFSGGRLLVEPGKSVILESMCIMVGDDPWALLCRYGDRVASRHGVRVPEKPPVSWCSWYPYRLGVTEKRVLATAETARRRLAPLGLQYMLLDLGWQKGYLPSSFEENEQFPSGLKALSAELEHMGFALGAWCAPYTISVHDPLNTQHPEWLLSRDVESGSERRPEPSGDWFWEPHGETYALDLTHPEAQQWLRRQMRSLADRGVRYLKPDFIGGVAAGHLTGRHDRTVVAGGGAEASRIGMEIMRREIMGRSAEALVLNCGGPEIPGRGAFPLLYTCNDTGNTGYVGWKHLEEDYGRNVAGHLWKNRRWGIIQPSCMVVGLPGTVEEARLRATATFLAGGQVDIGDDLLTLPEDRWHILQATLPPLGITATPVDLFTPIETSTVGYDALASRGQGDEPKDSMEGPSRVWTVPVRGTWDEWSLVGLFNYDTNDNVPYGKAQITRFLLPLKRLGLDPMVPYSVLEFWGGQLLGRSPFVQENPRGYRHPGDAQSLVQSVGEDRWEVSFFGPGVKLLIVRKARTHPWPAGTSFHQSGGMELQDVEWKDPVLRGVLSRPVGEQGDIIVCTAGRLPKTARVGRRSMPFRIGANGACVLPVTVEADPLTWEVRFA